jgi:MarR family transcriptional regulator, temperature-dependent positive regulator of motility
VTETGPRPEALRAIQAWVRLDRALGELDQELRAELGVTGGQLAMLRIVAEMAPVTLAELRARLVLHPATLGQMVDRLAAKDLVELQPDPADRRRRAVRLTPAGQDLLRTAPVAGPVRLRTARVETARLERLADALDDAIELFGLTRWTQDED